MWIASMIGYPQNLSKAHILQRNKYDFIFKLILKSFTKNIDLKKRLIEYLFFLCLHGVYFIRKSFITVIPVDTTFHSGASPWENKTYFQIKKKFISLWKHSPLLTQIRAILTEPSKCKSSITDNWLHVQCAPILETRKQKVWCVEASPAPTTVRRLVGRHSLSD